MLELTAACLLPNRLVDGKRLRLTDKSGRRLTATGWIRQWVNARANSSRQWVNARANSSLTATE
jgi:hypothetical protein